MPGTIFWILLVVICSVVTLLAYLFMLQFKILNWRKRGFLSNTLALAMAMILAAPLDLQAHFLSLVAGATVGFIVAFGSFLGLETELE